MTARVMSLKPLRECSPGELILYRKRPAVEVLAFVSPDGSGLYKRLTVLGLNDARSEHTDILDMEVSSFGRNYLIEIEPRFFDYRAELATHPGWLFTTKWGLLLPGWANGDFGVFHVNSGKVTPMSKVAGLRSCAFPRWSVTSAREDGTRRALYTFDATVD